MPSTRAVPSVVSLTLVLGLVSAVGCKEDDPGGAPQVGGVDAGGAGGDGSTTSNPDGSIPSGSGVTVTVKKGTEPVADVRIVLHDESGAVTGELRTDANGIATSPVAPKQLTVIHRAGGAPFLTYVDVAEGDSLAVDISAATGATVANVSMSLQPNEEGSPSLYEVRACGCGGVKSAADTTNPFVVPFYDGCPAPKRAILGTAYAGEAVLGYVWRKDIALPAEPGDTLTVPPSNQWGPPKELRIKVIGAPEDGDVISRADLVVDGLTCSLGSMVDGYAATVGDVYALPNGFADAIIAQVMLEAEGSTIVFASIDPTGGSGTGDKGFDFKYSDALPRITQKSASTTAARRPEATWAIDGPLGSAAGGVARLSWETPNRASWVLVIPPDRTTGIKTPELPADVVDLPPAGSLTAAKITFYRGPFSSYAAFKKVPFHPPLLDHRDEDLLVTSRSSFTSTSR